MLLDTLTQARPNHDLLLGDFDKLPDVRISGRNAPLVATTVSIMPGAQQEMEFIAGLEEQTPSIRCLGADT